MRTPSWKLGIVILVLVVLVRESFGFSLGSDSPWLLSKNAQLHRYAPASKSPSTRRRSPPLQYRLAEEEDDDTTLLRVKNRAPPGFDMRKALAKQEEEARQKPPKSAVNRPLVKALLLNQALVLFLGTVIGCLAFLFADGFEILSNLGNVFQWNGDFQAIFPDNHLLVGALWAIPALAFSNFVEASDRREFANVNFSTIIMVLSLFGRRTAPPQEFLPKALQGRPLITTSSPEALLYSLLLSTVTGLCEETVFRAEVPSLMTRFLGWDPTTTLLGSAFIFGLGHAQPGSSLMENGIVVNLQAVNGVWFGLLYLLTGGDVLSCIVTHAVFDFIVFFKTWNDANTQIEYAERMYLQPLDPEVEREVQRALKGNRMEPLAFKNIKRLFYTFDFDKSRTLSLSEVRKGLSYYALERRATPPRQEQVDDLFAKVVAARSAQSITPKNRLDFSDFVRLVSLSSQQAKARAATAGGRT